MNRETFEDYLSRLVDNQLSSAEFAELEQYLISNPEARAEYMEYMDMQNLLLLEMEKKDHVLRDAPKVINIESVLREQRVKALRIAALSAVAVVLITGIIMAFLAVDRSTPAIAFRTSVGTQYTLTHDHAVRETADPNILETGSRLQLSQGSVELTFKTGVKAIIVAPADLTLYNENTVSFKEGNGWFQVPKEAIGFTVKTKQMDVIDLGTEFGILSHPDLPDEVHVLKGRVRVTSLTGNKDSLELGAEQGRLVEHNGRISETEFRNDLFLTTLPEGLPYVHWSFDSVDNGAFPAKGSMPEISTGSARPAKSPAENLLTSGRVGNAVKFSSTPSDTLASQWYNLPSDQAGSICCWVKIERQSLKPYGNGLIAWGVSKNNFDGWSGNIKLALSPTGHLSLVGFDGSFTSENTVADGQWHHVATTYQSTPDGPMVNLYIDGNIENVTKMKYGNQSPNWSTTNRMPQEILFGSNLSNSAPINGSVDEAYIFKGIVDQATIQDLARGLPYTPKTSH